MSSIANPYGLRPINMIGGQANNGGGMREYRMTANSATGLFSGDLIQISAGEPVPLTATPTTSTAGVVGVFAGCSYVDPVLKYEVHAQFLPANAVNSGYTNIRVRVYEDPDQLYTVQATGAVTRASIGKNAPLGNFSNGSTVTGNSKVSLTHGSIAVTATLAVRIVDLVDGGGSTPGDAYTDCIVKLNHGVHAYYNSTGL